MPCKTSVDAKLFDPAYKSCNPKVLCSIDGHVGILYRNGYHTGRQQEDVDKEVRDLYIRCIFLRICLGSCSWSSASNPRLSGPNGRPYEIPISVLALLLEPTGSRNEYRRRGMAVIPRDLKIMDMPGEITSAGGWEKCDLTIV